MRILHATESHQKKAAATACLDFILEFITRPNYFLLVMKEVIF
jgi:hypothetical protein